MLSWIKNNQNWWKKNSWYFAVCLPPCHSARSWKRSRRIHVRVINPRPLGEGGPLQTVRECREDHFPRPFIHTEGQLLNREEFVFRLLKQWILQLRASPACRITGGWVERLEEESSSIKCEATNFKYKLTLFFIKDMNQLKTNLSIINPKPKESSIKNQ